MNGTATDGAMNLSCAAGRTGLFRVTLRNKYNKRVAKVRMFIDACTGQVWLGEAVEGLAGFRRLRDSGLGGVSSSAR